MNPGLVYVLPLTGELADAKNFVARRFPGRELVTLEKRALREAGWRGQIKAFKKMRGEALIFFVRSWSELQEPQLIVWSSLLHHCRFTVLADSSGRALVCSRFARLLLLPKALASALNDVLVFAIAWLSLKLLMRNAQPAWIREQSDVDMDLAYLYPYPLDAAMAGGALSHIEGFLSGVAASGSRCEVFSGRTFPFERAPINVIPVKRRLFLFRESLMLSYNLRFALSVRNLLRGRTVRALYQRHGRFMVAGALLSRWFRVPLVLEFNGLETWIADFWDPSRFTNLLRLCERVSLLLAHRIVVVSEPLKQELLNLGIPEDRILLNPNAVDPAAFYPGCGGRDVRNQLGFSETDVVVSFVGTFNYFHGVRVLEHAILKLLDAQGQDPVLGRLRFLLIGEGPLHAEISRSLEKLEDHRVVFTGLLPHSLVPTYLDAADILISPHVPMPDGRPFFGSPTKLFEYMAMAKAIIASDLDQLSCVLRHERTGWLVEPGSVSELASAILLLAQNPALRSRLGEDARVSVTAEHTWRQNAERVLACIRESAANGTVSEATVQG